MTGKDRYWQAVRKAQIRARRELEQFLRGDIDVLPCSGDYEREYLIAELDKVKS